MRKNIVNEGRYKMNKIKLKVLNARYVVICILFTIICILTSFFISSNSSVFKSFYMNQLLGTNSTKGLMYMIGSENRYFAEEFHKEKGRASLESFLLSLSTNINVNDLRSLLTRELPNMNQFYSEILIAGEGTDYTNIPEESSIPLDKIKDKGTAIEHPKSGKKTILLVKSQIHKITVKIKFLFIIHIVGKRLFLLFQELRYLMMLPVQIMK